MGPLRGRGGVGRMVWEPRRGPPEVGRDPRHGAASVARYECQRVVRGGGRGEGRDAVSIMAWPSAWLSQATRTVDLRSPTDRLPIAGRGGLAAAGRRDNLTSGGERIRAQPLWFSPAWPVSGR